MIDAEKTKSAKEWIEKLANGVNPLNNTPLNDTDIVNDVHISRCLFYVAEVLENSLHSKASKSGKNYAREFALSNDDVLRVNLFPESGITNFVKEINKVVPADMRPISVTQVLRWLLNAGLLEEVVLEDKKTKQATEKGVAIGIQSGWKDSGTGQRIFASTYSINAQKYILANVNLMTQQND